MKKLLSLILALVLCISLCACTENTNTLSETELTLVGEWEPTSADYSDRTLVLLKSGSGIWVYDSGSGMDFDWEVLDGKLYILDHNYSVSSGLTNMYTISGTSLIHPDGTVAFTKK